MTDTNFTTITPAPYFYETDSGMVFCVKDDQDLCERPKWLDDLLAYEDAQRTRMEARFSARQVTPATEDFDLPHADPHTEGT